MKNVNQQLYDVSIKSQVDMLRLSATEQRQALKLLDELGKDISAGIAKIDPAGAKAKTVRYRRLLKLQDDVGEIIDKAYVDLRNTNNKNLVEFAGYEIENMSQTTNRIFGLDVTKVILKTQDIKSLVNNSTIDGKIIGDWWNKKSDEFKERFNDSMNNVTKQIQMGTLKGDALGQMRKALMEQGGPLIRSKREADALIRTSYAQVASDSRMAFYKENEKYFGAYIQISTLDSRTCLTADQKILTPIGYKLVTDIFPGDKVIGGLTGQERSIVASIEEDVEEIAIVELENGEIIKCTPDHMFLLTNGKWMEAQYLKEGMDIQEGPKYVENIDYEFGFE